MYKKYFETIPFNHHHCSFSIQLFKNDSLQFGFRICRDLRDQQIYQFVKIGSQEWFGDDLKYETPGSYCYDNNPENCKQYGRLYNFPEAKTACPQGWRLPTEKDWRKLEQELGMTEIQVDSIRIWRGTNEGEMMINKLRIKFSGSGKSKGYKFRGKDQYVNYWVNEPGTHRPTIFDV